MKQQQPPAMSARDSLLENVTIDEVEARLRPEVDQWFDELPLYGINGFCQLLEWDRKLKALVGKIAKIQLGKDRGSKLHDIAVKWLKTLHFLPGQEILIQEFASDLEKRVKDLQENEIQQDLNELNYDERDRLPISNNHTNKSHLGDLFEYKIYRNECVNTTNICENKNENLINEIKRTKNFCNENQSEPGFPVTKSLSTITTANLIEEITREWCCKIEPYLEDKEKDWLQGNLAIKIINKINELNNDRHLLNDEILYDILLDGALEKYISELPQTKLLQQMKDTLKYQLKESIRLIKPLIREERIENLYKSNKNPVNGLNPTESDMMIKSIADRYDNLFDSCSENETSDAETVKTVRRNHISNVFMSLESSGPTHDQNLGCDLDCQNRSGIRQRNNSLPETSSIGIDTHSGCDTGCPSQQASSTARHRNSLGISRQRNHVSGFRSTAEASSGGVDADPDYEMECPNREASTRVGQQNLSGIPRQRNNVSGFQSIAEASSAGVDTDIECSNRQASSAVTSHDQSAMLRQESEQMATPDSIRLGVNQGPPVRRQRLPSLESQESNRVGQQNLSGIPRQRNNISDFYSIAEASSAGVDTNIECDIECDIDCSNQQASSLVTNQDQSAMSRQESEQMATPDSVRLGVNQGPPVRRPRLPSFVNAHRGIPPIRPIRPIRQRRDLPGNTSSVFTPVEFSRHEEEIEYRQRANSDDPQIPEIPDSLYITRRRRPHDSQHPQNSEDSSYSQYSRRSARIPQTSEQIYDKYWRNYKYMGHSSKRGAENLQTPEIPPDLSQRFRGSFRNYYEQRHPGDRNATIRNVPERDFIAMGYAWPPISAGQGQGSAAMPDPPGVPLTGSRPVTPAAFGPQLQNSEYGSFDQSGRLSARAQRTQELEELQRAYNQLNRYFYLLHQMDQQKFPPEPPRGVAANDQRFGFQPVPPAASTPLRPQPAFGALPQMQQAPPAPFVPPLMDASVVQERSIGQPAPPLGSHSAFGVFPQMQPFPQEEEYKHLWQQSQSSGMQSVGPHSIPPASFVGSPTSFGQPIGVSSPILGQVVPGASHVSQHTPPVSAPMGASLAQEGSIAQYVSAASQQSIHPSVHEHSAWPGVAVMNPQQSVSGRSIYQQPDHFLEVGEEFNLADRANALQALWERTPIYVYRRPAGYVTPAGTPPGHTGVQSEISIPPGEERVNIQPTVQFTEPLHHSGSTQTSYQSWLETSGSGSSRSSPDLQVSRSEKRRRKEDSDDDCLCLPLPRPRCNFRRRPLCLDPCDSLEDLLCSDRYRNAPCGYYF